MKSIKKIMVTSLTLCMMFVMCGVVKADAASDYELIFRAGSHGRFNTSDLLPRGLDSASEGKVVYRLPVDTPGNEVAGRAPGVEADSGYVFSGWEIDPNAPLTQKTTYVAKYRRIADGVQYTVRYMDGEGTDISSPAVGVINKNSEVSLYARVVEGYALQSNPGARVTVTEDGQEIIFLYASTAEGGTTVVPTPGETITITIPGGTTTVTVPGTVTSTTTGTTGTAGGTGAAGTTGTTGGTAGTDEETGAQDETVVIQDEEIPLAEDEQSAGQSDSGETFDIEDEDVPLAESPTEKQTKVPAFIYGILGIGAIGLIGAVLFVFLKKKNTLI